MGVDFFWVFEGLGGGFGRGGWVEALLGCGGGRWTIGTA